MLLYPPVGDIMYRPKNTQEAILHRLKIVRGHLDKIIRMVEQDQYCIDIIHQSQAVQAALKQTDQVVLKNHLQTCVVDSIKHGNSGQVTEEIMKIFTQV